MGLPTSLGALELRFFNASLPPFLSSAGNVYCVVGDTTNVKLHVYKATDPTSSFTEVDSANVPAQTVTAGGSTRGSVWVIQNGDVLSIAAGTESTTPAYKFHQFNMSTDLWSTTIKDKAIASPTIVTALNASISIIKRSNGDFIALFNGAKETLMGGGNERVSYSKSTDGGATWSAETAVGATGVKRAITGSVIVLGASDRSHFFYSDTTANAKHRSLSSAGALDTEAAVVTTVGSAAAHNYGSGISYVSGANTVVKVPVNSTTGGKVTNTLFNSGANPTINTQADYTDATVNVNGAGTCSATHAINTTTNRTYSLFRDNLTDDLIQDSVDDGGSWGTDINQFAGIIFNHHCKIYTRAGSLVLAYIMNDNNTIKYNEISLVTGPTVAQRLPAWMEETLCGNEMVGLQYV